MTLRRLRDIVNMMAEDERLLDGQVYVSKVGCSGAVIFGPTMMQEYDWSGEFTACCQYFTLPWRAEDLSSPPPRGHLLNLGIC